LSLFLFFFRRGGGVFLLGVLRFLGAQNVVFGW